MIFKSCLFSCPQEVKKLTEMLLADYFYGDESEQFSYFRIPRLLITSPRFKGLSTDAKLLYVVNGIYASKGATATEKIKRLLDRETKK